MYKGISQRKYVVVEINQVNKICRCTYKSEWSEEISVGIGISFSVIGNHLIMFGIMDV